MSSLSGRQELKTLEETSDDFDECSEIVGTEVPPKSIGAKYIREIRALRQKITAKPQKLKAHWTVESRKELRKNYDLAPTGNVVPKYLAKRLWKIHEQNKK